VKHLFFLMTTAWDYKNTKTKCTRKMKYKNTEGEIYTTGSRQCPVSNLDGEADYNWTKRDGHITKLEIGIWISINFDRFEDIQKCCSTNTWIFDLIYAVFLGFQENQDFSRKTWADCQGSELFDTRCKSTTTIMSVKDLEITVYNIIT